MQNSNIYLTFIAFSMFLFSCKQDKSTVSSKETQSEETEEGAYVSANQPNAADVAIYVANARNILDYRIKEDTNGSWAAIEHGIWEYEAIFANGEMSKPEDVAGKWIDYKDDNTYEFGEKALIKGKGKYHYNPDSGLVLMLNDDKFQKPIEYKVKIVGDIMVFTGSAEYKDNGTQGKLKKVMERPS